MEQDVAVEAEVERVLVLGAFGTFGREMCAILGRSKGVRLGALVRPEGFNSTQPARWLRTVEPLGSWPAKFPCFPFGSKGDLARALRDFRPTSVVVAPPAGPSGPLLINDLMQCLDPSEVRHAVLIVPDSDQGSELTPSDIWSIRSQQLVRSGGVPSTTIRSPMFNQNFATRDAFAWMVRAGRVRLPLGDARLPWVDVRDVASVAANRLRRDRQPGHYSFRVTGPALLHGDELAQALTCACSREVQYEPCTDAEWMELLRMQGFPHELIGASVARFEKLRKAHEQSISDATVLFTGNVPRDFGSFCADYAPALRRQGIW